MVLKASGITKEEAVEHPQAVLDALAFHMDGSQAAAQQMRQKMPSKEIIAKDVTEVSYFNVNVNVCITCPVPRAWRC